MTQEQPPAADEPPADSTPSAAGPPPETAPADASGEAAIGPQSSESEAVASSTGGGFAAPDAGAAEPEAAATVVTARRGAGLPPWLPLFLLAAVPALIVGVAVYAFAGDSGSSSAVAPGVLDSFIRQFVPIGGQDTPIESLGGEIPSDFPGEFPVYTGAEVVASFAAATEESTIYLLVFSSRDAPQKVYEYYLDRLNADPWQVEIGQSSDEVTFVRFSRPDNADMQGNVVVQSSDLDGRTGIFVTFQDLSKKGVRAGATKPFVLSASRPLPPDYPTSDVPIFKGQPESVVIDSGFQRAAGGKAFYVSFLTKGSQSEVLQFYRDEFSKRGWTVKDSETDNQFALGIDFDGGQQQLSGSVSADQFEGDGSFTRVDLLVQVAGSRGRGN